MNPPGTPITESAQAWVRQLSSARSAPTCPLGSGIGEFPSAGSTRAPSPTRGQHTVALSINLNKALDKAWENKSLDEILKAPPSALAGLTEQHDQQLKDALGITTIAQLGSNKYFALAGALVALSTKVD